jgi:hypothetical protein
MSLAAAAKRGDELAQSAQPGLPESHTGATIIPFERPEPYWSARQTERAAR